MSLEKQLKEVKLKKTQGMIKDYSDPKLAGNDKSIELYCDIGLGPPFPTRKLEERTHPGLQGRSKRPATNHIHLPKQCIWSRLLSPEQTPTSLAPSTGLPYQAPT